jgi:hypothetical protein
MGEIIRRRGVLVEGADEALTLEISLLDCVCTRGC